jgi:hypothetical protein
VNCCVLPKGIDGAEGEIAMFVITRDVTVNVAWPVIDPEVAVMMVVPDVIDCASPLPSIEAMLVEAADHVADVRLRVEPSENVPVAANC